MNKKQFLAAAFCLMALAGCTQKTELPENPKDQEEYRDHQGNSWIYNAMLMRWAWNVSLSVKNICNGKKFISINTEESNGGCSKSKQ